MYFHIISILQQTLNPQIIINPQMRKECVFKEAPKYWFLYIKAFLHANMRTISTQFNAFDFEIIRYNIRRTVSILKLSTKIFFSISKPEDYNMSQTVKAILWYQQLNVKNIRFLLEQKWIIKLDEKLRANITFDCINIYVNLLFFCAIGDVKVSSVLNSR